MFVFLLNAHLYSISPTGSKNLTSLRPCNLRTHRKKNCMDAWIGRVRYFSSARLDRDMRFLSFVLGSMLFVTKSRVAHHRVMDCTVSAGPPPSWLPAVGAIVLLWACRWRLLGRQDETRRTWFGRRLLRGRHLLHTVVIGNSRRRGGWEEEVPIGCTDLKPFAHCDIRMLVHTNRLM